MNKILITGGCGYVGSVLVPKLLKLKYKVIVLDTQWFGINLKKNKNLTIIKKDVRDISGIEMDFMLSKALLSRMNMWEQLYNDKKVDVVLGLPKY